MGVDEEGSRDGFFMLVRKPVGVLEDQSEEDLIRNSAQGTCTYEQCICTEREEKKETQFSCKGGSQ